MIDQHIWTPEEKQYAAKLWNEGYSAAEISLAMGHSRNSIIGIAGRNRHLFKSKGQGSKGTPKQPQTKTKAERPTYQPRNPIQMVWSNIPKPPKATELAIVFGEPPSNRVTILTVTKYQCRWPTNDANEEFHMCGHEVKEGKSYCPYHHKRSVGPGTQSERKAA
jgi:Uncharacterized protein conserved in bacteria